MAGMLSSMRRSSFLPAPEKRINLSRQHRQKKPWRDGGQTIFRQTLSRSALQRTSSTAELEMCCKVTLRDGTRSGESLQRRRGTCFLPLFPRSCPQIPHAQDCLLIFVLAWCQVPYVEFAHHDCQATEAVAQELEECSPGFGGHR